MEIIPVSGMELSEIERGSDGLPRAWPIFRAGDNIVTQRNSLPINLKLSRDDLSGMVDYYKAKGAKIPIDCQHVVSNLAGRIGMDEAELLKKLPRYSGVAGFGALELRGDVIYLSDAEWLPIGAEVMRAGQYRYYSPSIRGLDGKSPLRIGSVALTNHPCMQQLPSLAASEDEDEEVTPEKVRTAQEHITQKKEAIMPEENKGTGAAAAAAATPEPEKKNDAELLAILREVLGGDVTPENLKVTLAALKTKADSTAELSEKVKTLECAESARKQTEEAALLASAKKKGFARGVLTPATLEKPYIKNMSAQELSEYCDSLPDGCVAPVKALELSEAQETPAAAQELSLSPVQKAIRSAPVI